MKALSKQFNSFLKWANCRSLEWWSGYFTVVYLGVITLVLAANLEDLFKLKLNELGDFLAGVFGPVAFLWLVLGYIQQGKELRLQARELKNSVEQQVIMAESAENHLKLVIEANEIQKEEVERQLKASFKIRVKGSTPNINFPGSETVDWEIQNVGMDAYDVEVEFIPMLKGNPWPIGDIEEGDIWRSKLAYPNDRPTNRELSIKYLGIDGRYRKELFICRVNLNPFRLVFRQVKIPPLPPAC